MDSEVVFGVTEHRALNYLEELVKKIEMSKDEYIEKKWRGNVYTNKRRIVAVPLNENSRGRKCSKVYVDSDLKIRQLHEQVLPILIRNFGKTYEDMLEDQIVYY